MKQVFLLFLSFMLLTGSSSAQLLWRVTPPGCDDKPSYVFGTHHLVPTAFLDSVKGFDEALASVDAVYGEIDMTAMADPANLKIMMDMAAAPADSTLTKLLTHEQLDSLQKICDKYLGGVPYGSLDAMKPAMISNMISIVQTQSQLVMDGYTIPLDDEIQRRARAAGKNVAGLETIEQQSKALFGYPIIDQAADLMELIRSDEESLVMIKRLTDAYLSGDLHEILAVIESPASGMSDKDADRLINSRNADWLRILAGLLPTASIMIAVGAGHLPGEKGILEGFRRLGFNVEPVDITE